MAESIQLSDVVVVRTAYGADDRWRVLASAVRSSADAGGIAVLFLEDRRFDGRSVEHVDAAVRGLAELLLVADEEALGSADHPLLAVNPLDPSSPAFRIAPAEVAGLFHDISLANMDWEDYLEGVGADGVFRGFDGPSPGEAARRSTTAEDIAEANLASLAGEPEDSTGAALRQVRWELLDDSDR